MALNKPGVPLDLTCMLEKENKNGECLITQQVKCFCFLDLSVSQYSLVGGPFCINLSRIALLFKTQPLPQLNILVVSSKRGILVARWRKN